MVSVNTEGIWSHEISRWSKEMDLLFLEITFFSSVNFRTVKYGHNLLDFHSGPG